MMQDSTKIGAAALGGYVLGRTKKAKAAIGLALWLSGRGRPRDLLRNQAAAALQSDLGQELLGQVRGPLLSASRRAALSLVEAQAGRLGDSLKRRAGKLTELPAEVAGLVERAHGHTAEDDGEQTDADDADARAQNSADQAGGGEKAAASQDSADQDDSADQVDDDEDEASSQDSAGEPPQERQPRRPRRRAVWSAEDEDAQPKPKQGSGTATKRPARSGAGGASTREEFEGVAAKRKTAPIRRSGK